MLRAGDSAQDVGRAGGDEVKGFVNHQGCRLGQRPSAFDMNVMNYAGRGNPKSPRTELTCCPKAKAGQTGKEIAPSKTVCSAGSAAPQGGCAPSAE